MYFLGRISKKHSDCFTYWKYKETLSSNMILLYYKDAGKNATSEYLLIKIVALFKI